MKILEIINVDFSLRHFLLPLMRCIRARGHDVIGACADGPLLDDVRGDFRIDKGQMHTDNLALEGPAAKVTLTGNIDLAKETQQLDVPVLKNVQRLTSFKQNIV